MEDWELEDLKEEQIKGKERIEKQYWINTRGRIIKYKGDDAWDLPSLHYEIAIREFPKLEANNRGQTDYLLKLGWIMIGSTAYHKPIAHKLPTQKQLDTLFDNPHQLERLGILHKGHYIKLKDYEKL